MFVNSWKYSPARPAIRFVYRSDRACPCHASPLLSCHPRPYHVPTSLLQCAKLHYSSPASIRSIVVTGLAPVMFPIPVMLLLAPVMFLLPLSC